MKKEGGKKGQFTVFVILGIVMLVMVLFILYAVSQISTANTQRALRQSAIDILDSSMVNYYVQTCLDAATTTAIDELMLQGGTLREDQNGLFQLGDPGVTHIPINIKYDDDINITTNATYSITKKNDCPIIEHEPPWYPKDKTKLIDLFPIYQQTYACSFDAINMQDYSGFFGQNNLTRLCTVNSENAKPIPGVGFSPCHLNWQRNTTTTPKPLTIEELLEARILELLSTCINFDDIAELQGTNITLNEDQEPEVKVIYNRNSLSVKAIYPFTAQLRPGESAFIRHEFNYASPLRLVRLHNYAMSLLTADAKDIFFNLSSPQHQREYTPFTGRFPNIERYYDPFFEVTIHQADCELVDIAHCNNIKFDRVLVIKDKASYIGGRPLTFATAIQNRRPALEYISLADPTLNYHIQIGIGEELIINPEGYDPDDGNLTYVYRGWKETYDKVCEITDEGEFSCTQIEIEEDDKLTNSVLFQETKRQANHTTKDTDIGLHTVTVYVYDAQGLYDYQDIRILVFEAPTTDAITQSIYDDLPENVTSIEDPITIIGTIHHDSQFQIQYLNYSWEIINNAGDVVHATIENSIYPNNMGTESTDVEFIIPFDEEDYDSNLIQEIKNLLINETGLYKIIFKAGVKYMDDALDEYMMAENFEILLNVTACIPHRNATPIYPYNDLENPFLANHTCCAGAIGDITSYELFEDNKICYTKTIIGEITQLKNKAEDEMKNDELQNYLDGEIQPQINYPPQPYNPNSIFEMTLERYCDGERGNICAGNLIATLTVYDECEYNENLLEQCQGPLPQGNIQQTCHNYTSTTFSQRSYELEYGLENSDGDSATGKCLQGDVCAIPQNQIYGAINATHGIKLCYETYCNQGRCTRIFLNDCVCDAQICNAECDEDTQFLWTNNICKFGDCTQGSCTFEEENETKCEEGINNCYNETSGFCHTEVDCTNTGAIDTKNDFCTKEILYEANITTATPPNHKIINVCLHGDIAPENACTDEGACEHEKTYFECLGGRSPQCQESGAKCCLNSNCLDPTGIIGVTYIDPDVQNYIFPAPYN